MFHHSSTNAEFAPACGVRYLLIDGTAAYEVLCKLDVFKEGADWFRSLALHPSMELAAPMLVDPEMAVAQGRKHTLERVMRAYPLQLHCSQIHSPYSMDELAPHIMQFMSFVDSFNSRYILRLADSRCIGYMVDIFTPEQWQALTGPFSRWEITTRRNVLRALPLGEVTAPGPLATPFTLSDEQIQLLVDACEPDAVLADLDMDTRSIKPQDIAPKHETAVMCVNVWRQYSEANPKRSDRRVLRMFAQKALDESPADWLHSQEAFKVLDEISQGLPWS